MPELSMNERPDMSIAVSLGRYSSISTSIFCMASREPWWSSSPESLIVSLPEL